MSADAQSQLSDDLGGRDPYDVDADELVEAIASGDYGTETDATARANGTAYDDDEMSALLAAPYVRRYQLAGDYLIVWTAPDGVTLYRSALTPAPAATRPDLPHTTRIQQDMVFSAFHALRDPDLSPAERVARMRDHAGLARQEREWAAHDATQLAAAGQQPADELDGFAERSLDYDRSVARYFADGSIDHQYPFAEEGR